MIKTARYWIEKLELEKHPEGGWFREVYRSEDVVSEKGLPAGFKGERNFSTSIYYLLEKDNFSAFHRIKSDELWHYYTGTSAIEILSVVNGRLKKQLVGNDVEQDQQFQFFIPKNTWFAAHLADKKGYALVGCTVSPGFHFEDFELAGENFTHEFPEMKDELFPFLKK